MDYNVAIQKVKAIKLGVDILPNWLLEKIKRKELYIDTKIKEDTEKKYLVAKIKTNGRIIEAVEGEYIVKTDEHIFTMNSEAFQSLFKTSNY